MTPENTHIDRPTFSDTRSVVAIAARRGLPVAIARKGYIHLVRSLAELEQLDAATKPKEIPHD